MKILVAIANYGTGSRQYIDQVLDAYRNMSHDVDLVVHSNIPKDFGQDVEVIVGMPSKDSWSLPFAHKQTFADRIDDYDLFIYTEDDIFTSEHAVNAFVKASGDLNDDEITGYMRFERRPDGTVSYDMAHSFYRWDPRTVVERNGDIYAWFSNEHAAAYALTPEQLRRCIDSGGYLVAPYMHRYNLPETAATDPYTSCGMTKLINVSKIEDFLIHHLPDKYLDVFGIDADMMAVQLEAITKIAKGELPRDVLIEVENRLPKARGSKRVYAKADTDLLDALNADATEVLVVGAGHGALERAVVQRGHAVTAVPVDSIIGYALSAQGIETTPADVEQSVNQLVGRQFDALVLPESLHLFEDPAGVLEKYLAYIKSGGQILATVPNLADASFLKSRLKGDVDWSGLGDFKKSGTHHTTKANVTGWFKRIGVNAIETTALMTEKRQKMNMVSLGAGKGLLANQWLIQAVRV